MDLDIIQYEKIPMPQGEAEPGSTFGEMFERSTKNQKSSKESATSSSSEDNDFEEDPVQPEKIKAEAIDIVLDSLFLPRRIEHEGNCFLLRLSRQPASRSDLSDLTKRFEDHLRQRQVRMKGYCPIRRELYEMLFDELIRQSTVFCPERGSLLLRIRDELKMTTAAYEKLFQNGIEYGSRKALEAEMERQSLQLQHIQLNTEVGRAEQRVKELRGKMEAEEALSRQRVAWKKMQHQEKMDFLGKANKQLKEQLARVA